MMNRCTYNREAPPMKRIFWSGFLLVLSGSSMSTPSQEVKPCSSHPAPLKTAARFPSHMSCRAPAAKTCPCPWPGPGRRPGRKSFALTIIDPHPVAHNWVHWLVMDIPGDATSLAEGASGKKMPPGAVELKNSWGELSYGGPQPPKGTGDHPYVVTLYALSVPKLDLKPTAGWAELKQAMEGKILGTRHHHRLLRQVKR